MTTALIGKWTKVWIEGYILSTKAAEVVFPKTEYDQIEESGFTEDKSTIFGQAKAMAGINGYFDGTTGDLHSAIKTIASGNSSLITTMALGNNAAIAQGDVAGSMVGTQNVYDVNPDLAGLIAAKGDFQAKGYESEIGILLADETDIGSSSNTSSVDQTAQSTNGAVAYLHVTAVDAVETITIKVQDSANDADWADLITFTLDGSTLGAERLTVAGTVDEYVRVIWTVTGDGSFAFAVNFIRT